MAVEMDREARAVGKSAAQPAQPKRRNRGRAFPKLSSIQIRRLAALSVQVMSWAATLAAAVHLIQPATTLMWAVAVGVGTMIEVILYGMKELLWDEERGDSMGYIGILLDWIVNAGGVVPYATRLLSWGPFAAIIGLLGIENTTANQTIGGLILSLIFGFILSIAPHVLWRSVEEEG
jgi:hypothetical protein